MKQRTSKVFVVVCSSILVVVFGLSVTFLNQADEPVQTNNIFVSDTIELNLPGTVDYFSENGFAFSYDKSKWSVVDQDTRFDIKLINTATRDTVTLISSDRNEGESGLQPNDYGVLDETSLRSVSEIFETKSSGLRDFENSQFFVLDYSLKLFDTSEQSDAIRYITASDDKVIKFISAYTSEETKIDVEELVDSFYLY